MKPKETQGLRNVAAGQTAICTVGMNEDGLNYRGYRLQDLVENASFEETAYLLIHDKLPNRQELDAFIQKLMDQRHLPETLKKVLEMIPKETHPMDAIRTGCSFLGNLEPEADFSQGAKIAERLLATIPTMIVYWYRYSHEGVRAPSENTAKSIAGHFLHMLYGRNPSELEEKVMNVSLILYAEHEFNASTFTGRTIASTLSDIYSAVVGAIGALRGNLHGGANEAAMEMIEKFSSPQDAEEKVRTMLKNKEKIMGFGHAVYKHSDPRHEVIKKFSRMLSEKNGDPKQLYEISCAVEAVMKSEKNLFPNADFFHASTYRFMNIPTPLFTPIFVCSRVSGWTAHIIEQRKNNKLIRPGAEYIGSGEREWLPLEKR